MHAIPFGRHLVYINVPDLIAPIAIAFLFVFTTSHLHDLPSPFFFPRRSPVITINCACILCTHVSCTSSYACKRDRRAFLYYYYCLKNCRGVIYLFIYFLRLDPVTPPGSDINVSRFIWIADAEKITSRKTVCGRGPFRFRLAVSIFTELYYINFF